MTELWREVLGPYQEMVDAGTDMVVAEINVRFLAPARFDDEITFEAWITRLGETAMSTRIDGTTQGEQVVAGELRHVFIDPASKTKRTMPDDVRTALEPYISS